MKNEQDEKMARDIAAFRLPRYAEITNVGLYLDQTVKFVNLYLSPLGGQELTGSMVSNYVKKGLLANPVKKQYSAEHIACLIFIALAKTVLPMDDIQLAIDIQKQSYSVQAAYDYFCGQLEQTLREMFRIVEASEDAELVLPRKKDLLRNIILTIAQSIYLSKYLEVFRAGEVPE